MARVEYFKDILTDGVGPNEKVLDFLENAMIDEILTVAEIVVGPGNARMSLDDWQKLQQAIEEIRQEQAQE
jgi:hypothetical protein